MLMMFVSYKMFFLWKWNDLGVDCIYSQNWSRVFEFIEKKCTTMKSGVVNKFCNIISETHMKYSQLLYFILFLKSMSTKYNYYKISTFKNFMLQYF
jgi:hypothetical protein